MQVSPIFDAVWKTMRRRLNRPVGFAFVAALLVVIKYQLASKPATAQGITYSLSGKASKLAVPPAPKSSPTVKRSGTAPEAVISCFKGLTVPYNRRARSFDL